MPAQRPSSQAGERATPRPQELLGADPEDAEGRQCAPVSSCRPETLPDGLFAPGAQPGWRTLRDWVRALICDRELVAEPVVWRVMAQLVRAAGLLHGARLVYRDWSPSLILVDALFCVRLLVPPEAPPPRPAADGEPLGVSSFVAPEALLGRPCTGAADVYSLGAVLYLLASLSKPRLIDAIDPGSGTVALTAAPVTLPPVYSANVYTFLELTLCLDPLRRASVAELLAFPPVERALADLLGGPGDAPPDGDSDQDPAAGGILARARPPVGVRDFLESIAVRHPNVRVRHRPPPAGPCPPRRPLKLLPLGEADPCCDALGHTQLMQAAIADDVVVAGRFVHLAGRRSDAGLTALMLAAALGHAGPTGLLATSEAQLRAQACVRINEWVFQGATALMFAAGFGHGGCVRHLCSREARMTDAYKRRTALMAACHFGHYSCAKVLAPLEARMRDAQGRTALMYAAEANHTRCAQCLAGREAGMAADGAEGRDPGWTALLFAVQEGSYECIKVLAPLEARVSGATALGLLAGDAPRVRSRLTAERRLEVASLIARCMEGTARDSPG